VIPPLQTCLGLLLALTLLPAVAMADRLPDDDTARWDLEDQDSEQHFSWRRGAYRLLDEHMTAWGWGAQLGPVLAASTLVGVGAALEVTSGTGYVLLYMALPVGASTMLLSFGIWPAFSVAGSIIGSSSTEGAAIRMLLTHAKIAAYTTLGLGLLATIAVIVGAAAGSSGPVIGGAIVAAGLPYVGAAAIGYNTIARILDARRRSGEGRHRFARAPRVRVEAGPGSVVIRF